MSFIKSHRFYFLGLGLLGLLFVVIFFNVGFANAQTVGQDTFGLQQIGNTGFFGTDDIRIIVARIINIALALLGIIAFGLVLYAGFVIMTAGGNEEKVAEGKKILINAVIGLAIILSAYAIVSFIITRLSQATGTGDTTLVEDCSNPGFALANPTLCPVGTFNCSTNRTCCSTNQFVVRSITPNTPLAPGIAMNNVTIRVIFSQPVSQSISADAVFTVNGSGGTSVNGLFDFSYLQGSNRTVVEAHPNAVDGHIPFGHYTVSINQGVTNDQGQAPQENLSCGDFPVTASFDISTDNQEDNTEPVINHDEVSIDGQSTGQGGFLQIARGAQHNITATLTDNNGIGYVHLSVVRVRPVANNSHPTTTLFDGPAINRPSGSSAEGSEARPPYEWSYPLLVAANTTALERYRVTVEVYDVDGNHHLSSVDYVVVGDHCNNNILDSDLGEVTTDRGGVCMSNGVCSEDSQCLSGHCDITAGICLNYPVITNVNQWNGASGNWITIEGTSFGETPGEVSFGRDQNGNGTIEDNEYTIQASLALCGALDVWRDNYVIVQVPGDDENTGLPINSRSPIRLSLDGKPTFFDTTINNSGPNSWAENGNNGVFTKNNIVRPGLCSLSPNIGEPRTNISVYGNAFPTDPTNMQVYFGGVRGGNIRDLSSSQFQTSVPINLQAGSVGVQVQVNGENSNGIPFTVTPSGEDLHPVVSLVDPATTTPGSYVTITGSRFGVDTGIVYLAPVNQTTACNSLSGSSCIQMVTNLPLACGDTWDDGRIIAAVPSDLTLPPSGLSDYRVVVQSNANLQSSGSTLVTVESGARRPSLCSVVPDSGPAPLSPGQRLHFTGINFTEDTDVFFWSNTADFSNLLSWLPQSFANVNRTNETSFDTSIPVVSGHSMQTGPIVARLHTSGLRSNSLNYTVNDCRVPGSVIPSGYKCCTLGADAGLLVSDNVACTGEPQNAGFVWRFTTAAIPHVPRVVEGCDVTNWNNVSMALDFPSPTPWVGHPQGMAACLNSQISARFTYDMDPDSFENNVRIISCGTGSTPNCSNSTDVTEQFVPNYSGQVLTMLPAQAGTELLANTWYRVQLLSGVRSREACVGAFGLSCPEPYDYRPLQATRPCGNNTAYCFDFKTGVSGSECTLLAAGIQPSQKIVNVLGQIRDASGLPLIYNVWGRGSQVCSVLSVEGLGWDWSISDSHTPQRASVTVDPLHDNKATASAYGNTSPQTIEILALEDQTRPQALTIPARSSLVINLGRPVITEKWPSCTAACINSGIGARFNREMVTSQFTDGNIRLYQCPTESCYQDQVGNLMPANIESLRVDIDLPNDQQTPTVFRATPRVNLLPDTWYQVQVSNLQAVSSYDTRTTPPTPIVDNTADSNLPTTIWKFKTKSGTSACSVSSVVILPNPFVASIVGEKTAYVAQPVGAPDACSTGGQPLRSEDYGWTWDTTDHQVASVTNFTSVSRLKSYCTSSCVPRGSNISRTHVGVVALCGNAVVDPGEDCDVGGVVVADASVSNEAYAPGQIGQSEIVNRSCSLGCLRPGNTNTDTCGNNLVEPLLGEECDPGPSSPTRNGCTSTCIHSGSSPESQRQIDVSRGVNNGVYCGSGTNVGAIGAGEECELNIAGGVLGVSCSSQCLHLGTPMAQWWCDQHASETISVGSNATLPVSDTVLCRNSQSQCGNGQLEASEECELNAARTQVLVHSLNSLTPLVSNLPVTSCNSSCLLQNICDLSGTTVTPYNIPSYLRCSPESEGCNATSCTYLGSSVLYGQSSICGDGVVGVGESSWCELSSTEATTAVSSATIPRSNPPVIIRNPVQAVTAVGLGTVVDGLMTTQVQATAVASRQVLNGQLTVNDVSDVTGQGDYSLKCGYAEFTTPQTTGSVDSFNNCPNSNNGASSGVGTNSCCYIRPTRTDNYPFDGAGLNGVQAPPGQSADPVCRNTLISVTFSGDIDESTLANNIIVARGAVASGTTLPPPPPPAPTGIVDDAMVFDGTNGQITENLPSLQFGTGDFSISSWVKIPVGFVAQTTYLQTRNTDIGTPATSISFVLNQNGNRNQTRFSIRTTSGVFNVDSSAVAVNDGNWHLISGVRSNNDIYLYVDGVQRAHTSSPSPIGSLSTGNPFYVGQTFTRPTVHFSGSIDELQFYNRVLTAAEILGIYNAQGAGVCKSAPAIRHPGCINRYDGLILWMTGDSNTIAPQTAPSQCRSGEIDVTPVVGHTLAMVQPEDYSWWQRIWRRFERFIVEIFKTFVYASTNNDRSVASWCSGGVRVVPQVSRVYRNDGSVESTKVTLAIQNSLEANSTYAVFLRGGTSGIKDVRGVGIWNNNLTIPSRDDSFIFRTGSNICTISNVTVNPTSQLFRVPNQTDVDDDSVPNNAQDFVATVSSFSGQQINPIPGVYDWQWSWGPTGNSIVNIASDDATNHQSAIRMRSTAVQGQVTAYANVVITADALHTDPAHLSENELGRIYSATVNINSLFCANPWPSIPPSVVNPNPPSIYPYEDGNTYNRNVNDDGYHDILNSDGTHSGYFDGSVLLPALVGGSSLYFNFSMGYCADSGRQGNLLDDLPYLRPLVLTQSGSLGSGTPTPTCPAGYQALRVNGSCVRVTSPTCPISYTQSTTQPTQCIPPQQFTPSVVGSFFDATRIALDRPYDVVVFEGYAYVASTVGNKISIFDVSDPSQPRFVSSINQGFGGASLNTIRKLFVDGDYLYASVAGTNKIEIFDLASSLTEPRPVSSVVSGQRNGAYVADLIRPYDIFVSNNLVFAASVGSDTLQIIDVTNKRAPLPMATISNGAVSGANRALLQGATGVAVVGQYAYVTSVDDDSVQSIYVKQDGTEPIVNGHLSNDPTRGILLDGPGDIVASPNSPYLYVASYYSNAIEVINISNPEQPQHVVSIPNALRGGHVSSVAISGDYLYAVSTDGARFGIFDISNPAVPVTVGIVEASTRATPPIYLGGAESVFISGDFAYIPTNNPALQVFNIAPPPVVTASCGNDGELQTNGSCTVRPSCGNSSLYQYDASRDRCIELHALAIPDSNFLTPLKKFLFLNEKNNDAIGVQVFANEPRATVRDWYVKHFGPVPNGFRDTTVDGYSAITDGDTYYINALNVADNHQIYNNVYLFSVSPNSKENTKQVFSALMNSLRFNINLTNVGYCSIGNGKNSDGTINYEDFNTATTPSVACSTDFDCPDVDGLPKICANAKTKLLRDWKRLENIRTVQSAIASYKSAPQATYPTLTAGTYVPGYTNSKWPSWSRFGTLLGVGLPHDQVDQWSGCVGDACSGIDSETFWNPATSQFICPNKMQVMEYKVDNSSDIGGGYQVYNPLEYLTPTLDFVGQYIDLSHFTNAPSCAPGSIFTAFPGSCGDGVVNTGEECDPPGSRVNRVAPGCFVAESTICGANCKWPVSDSCAPAQTCGNGIVEGTETCDDGGLNGTYGHCASSCQDNYGKYCGNGRPVGNAANDWLDRDAQGHQLEICEISEPRYSQTGFCRKQSCVIGRYNFTRVPASAVTIAGFDFVSSTTGWEVGRLTGGNGKYVILKTEDAGLHWTQQYAENTSARLSRVTFLNDQIGWVAASNGMILYTSNGGTSWTQRGQGIQISDVNLNPLDGIQFVDRNVGFAWTQVGTNIMRTTDGGTTWVSGNNFTFGTGVDTVFDIDDVDFVGPQYGWASVSDSNGAYLYKTVNGGLTWNRVYTLLGSNQSLNASFVDGSIGWVVGPNGLVAKTVDGGATFVTQNSNGSDYLTSVDFIDQNHGFASGGRNLYMTVDGGRNWASQIDSSVVGSLDVIDESNGFFFHPNLGGIVKFSPDPYCARIDDCGPNITTNSCLYGDQCVAVEDSYYHARNPRLVRPSVDSENIGSACAPGCQLLGAYCGDGILQATGPVLVEGVAPEVYEECDHGSRNGMPGDSCDAFCFIRPNTTDAPVSVAGHCGDGIVQSGGVNNEVCDTGSLVGIPCNPGYGRSCSYCAAGCRSNLTVNATAYCGNHIIDQIGTNSSGRPTYEACDTNSSNRAIVGDFDSITGAIIGSHEDVCTDRGTRTCSADCLTAPIGSCAVCATKQLANGGAVPNIAIINPMTGSNVNSGWGNSMSVGLFTRSDSVYGLPMEFFATVGSNHMMSRSLFADAATHGASGIGIESSELCFDGYEIGFNAPVSWDDWSLNPESIVFTAGDRFSYPVAGQPGSVTNEYLVSPAVPEAAGESAQFRIIVRWTDQERNYIFSGNIYNEALAGSGIASVIDYGRAVGDTNPPTNSIPAVDQICEGMRQQAGVGGGSVWVPDGCVGYDSSISVHPIGHLTNIYEQAITLAAGDGQVALANQTEGNTINTNYAFFVSTPFGSMSAQRNSNLQVEVYEYHRGQDDIHSIYKPTQTFSIRNATPGSTDTDAYWHVFNIVRVVHPDGTYKYEIRRFGGQQENTGDGSIESSFAQVLCNIPGHFCSQTSGVVSGSDQNTTNNGAADLSVNSLGISPANAVVNSGTTMNVTGYILNSGPGAITDAWYSVCVDHADCISNISNSISGSNTGAIVGGNSVAINASFNVNDIPINLQLDHTLYVCADTVNNGHAFNITEIDETNNCSSLPFTLSSGRTACVQDLDCPSSAPYCRANYCTYLRVSTRLCSADWQCGFDLLNPYHCDTQLGRCVQNN